MGQGILTHPINIPPLRERKSDIPALLQYFISKKSKQMNLPSVPDIEPGSVELLMEYSWPGNIRELENIIERELILNKNGPLDFRQILNMVPDKNKQESGKLNNSVKLDDVFTEHIKNILKKTNGKIHGPGGAAQLLGINANTLRNRMDRLIWQ